ncbi:MAG: hypothetical protein H6Q84_82 [Deltaproteobacteria bacterium]|nr:hypothetical protein [Deltaproteobacteria bacterium]
MLQVLGFQKDFIASYEAARATAAAIGEAVPEEGIFESMLFTISHAGAGVNLHKIFTSDKASETRWKKQLRAAGKTWADVQMPGKVQTGICEMLLKEIVGCFPSDLRKNAGDLRTSFRRYAKRYFA